MPSNFVGGETCIIVWTVCIVMHGAIDFGSKNDFFTSASALFKPATNDLLGETRIFAPTINVSGIKKVHTGIECRIHDTECLFFVCSRTKVHRAETDPADFKT